MTDSSAEDLQFNYIEHLQLEKLLTAQKFVSPHPEESVFVIMHQSYELWFRQVIHDLERIIAMLESDAVAQATWLIQRLGRIFQALDTQLGILEMMSAADFQEFRSYLKQSSGLQSRQFRQIEVMGGLCETVGEAYETRVRAQWPGLVEEVPTTLHRAFVTLVERQPRSLVEIYEQRWKQFELFALSEACVELDRQILTWRSNHVRMVERMIGDRAIGTGGTEGSRYLTSTTRYRFFPELWDVRNALTEASGGRTSSSSCAKTRPI